MIFYVVTDTAKQYRKNTIWLAVKHVLADCSGDLCMVLHYKDINSRALTELRPWAVCHSGGSTLYSDYDVLRTAAYRRLVTDCDVAQIGFCGGHQIIATFLGGRIGPMRRLKRGEPDLSGYQSGQLKEWGQYCVRILRPDPLFKGCGKAVRVQEYHAWEVKTLGRRLRLLASSDTCRVQAFVHRSRPIYGVQFHPEQSSENCPDGFKVLRNFFRLARACRKGGRARR